MTWELMSQEERRRHVEIADRKYALLMSGVPHDELDKWLSEFDQDPNETRLLDTEDVAKLLDLASKYSVTKLCRRNGLPRLVIRGASRFDLDEVVAWAKLYDRKVNQEQLAAYSGS